MPSSAPGIVLLAVFGLLTAANLTRIVKRGRFPLDTYLTVVWVFFLSFVTAYYISFTWAIWVIALLSFVTLREYLSLIDIRMQDRLGILGAYAAVPFMFYFVQIDWYGMFIIAIPVYAFLAIPLLISLGGAQSRGTVFSIGAIDFGLFLCVFCIGHIAYLMTFEIWMAAMLIASVALCDLVAVFVRRVRLSPLASAVLRAGLAAPVTVGLGVALSPWSGIPTHHAIYIGLMIPILAVLGQHTGDSIELDLGIDDDDTLPGRGQLLDDLKSLLFTAPVVFHYIRYFLR